jgi:hypothetical protein
MTIEQVVICKALGSVRYSAGSFDKRFGNNLSGIAENDSARELTNSQNEWMFRLLYKYRNQLPALYERFKGVPDCSKKDN